jgi:hypothetical protein
MIAALNDCCIKMLIVIELTINNCKIPLIIISVSCPALQPVSVSTGSVTLVTNGTTTSAEYSCPQGYAVKGSQTLTCNSDGTWSDEPSDCGIDKKLFLLSILNLKQI